MPDFRAIFAPDDQQRPVTDFRALFAPDESSAAPAPAAPQQEPSFSDKLSEAYNLANEHPGFAVASGVAKILGSKDPESWGREGEALVNSLGPLGMEFAPLATAPRPSLPKPMLPEKPPAPPETAAIKQAAQAEYKNAENSGLTVGLPSYRQMFTSTLDELKKEGLDRTLHKDTVAALQRFANEDMGPPKPDAMAKLTNVYPKEPEKTFTLQKLDTLRQVMREATKGYSEDKARDRRMANIALDSIDNWIEGLKPQDVVAGNPQEAVATIRKARELWGRYRKAEELDHIHERALNKVGANYSQADLLTAYRQEFKSIANRKSFNRRWNPEERAAILRIVRGDKLENVLRYLGKFAPSSPLGLLIGGAPGYAVGGPAGALTLPALGYTARIGANKLGQGAVNNLNQIVRGTLPSQ